MKPGHRTLFGVMSQRALFVVLAAICSPAGAIEQWIRVGPGPDAYVRNVRVFPNVPAAGQAVVFAATLGGGVVKIVDNGTSLATTQVNNGLPLLRIRSVGATDVNTLFAAVDSWGLYKSIDGGANWAAANGSGGTALACLSVRNMNVRTATEIWLATACRRNSGVYRTLDGGATWSRVGSPTIPDDAAINSLTFSGTGPATVVIAATGRDGLFRSVDNGATWTQTNGGIPAPAGANRISAFNAAFLANTSQMLAYVEGQGIFRTTDGGANWTPSGTGIPANTHVLGGFSRESATVLYVGTDKGPAYKTIDGGLNWSAWGSTGTIVDSPGTFVRGVTPDGRAAGQYWINSPLGLARTNDNGASINQVPIPEGFVENAAIADDGKKAYVVAGGGIYRFPDIYNPDWNAPGIAPVGDPLPATAGVVIIDRNNAGTLYATVPNRGIYKTVNDGATWTRLNVPNVEIGTAPAIELALADTQIVYAGLDNKYEVPAGGGFMKSVDGGTNWADSSTGLATAASRQVNSIAVQTDPAQLLIATDDGIYKSSNGGASWGLSYAVNDAFGTPLPFSSVRFDPMNGSVAWAAGVHVDPDGTVRASSGVYKTVDGGTTWAQVLSGKRAFGIRPEVYGRVIALLGRDLSQPPLLATKDGGATWQPFANGIQDNDGVGATRTTPPSNHLVMAMTAGGTYVLARPQLTMTAVGAGTVSWNVAAFFCRSTCTLANVIPDNYPMTITETPDAGSVFAGWSGACTGTGPCNFAMDGPKSVTGTFVVIGAPPTAYATPTSLTFAARAVGSTSPAQTVLITNVGNGTLSVSSVSTTNAQFAVTHDCSTLSTGASCTATITFTPSALGARTGNLTVVTNGGTVSADLSGTGIASTAFPANVKAVVTGYYETILGRAPDQAGLDFWAGEANRVVGLGADVREVFYAMSMAFFQSPEYIARNKSDTQYLTDMYDTFFIRPPDGPGLAYWLGELSAIQSRSALLNSFLFSTEFSSFMTGLFGTQSIRPEVNMAMDLFRGTFGRLPDSAGFNFWLGRIRTAQCTGAAAVSTEVAYISGQFFNSAEYLARARSDREFVGDVYNTFMRRGPGGDSAGFNFWVSRVPGDTRDLVRVQFVPSPEFQKRVGDVINAGCLP